MAEVQFAKSFLSALDGRPIKLSPDYAEDARRYPSRSPYTLPAMKKAMRKPQGLSAAKTAAPGSAPAITVAIKSMHRNPPLDVRLSGDYTLATTSLLDIRTALAAQTGVPLAKLKLLHNKKPVPDSKVLQDVAADGEAATVIELGVMVSGGAATVAAAQKEKEAAAAPGPVAEDATATEAAAAPAAAAEAAVTESKPAAETEAFWTDLRGFLLQRTKDAKHADELCSLFQRAYNERRI